MRLAPERLPLPSLEDTCTRYLQLVRPLASGAALERTEGSVRALLEEGRLLQKDLHRLAARHGGDYVGRFWRDMYLERREPLAPFQNAGLLFRLPEQLATLDVPRRA